MQRDQLKLFVVLQSRDNGLAHVVKSGLILPVFWLYYPTEFADGLGLGFKRKKASQAQACG